MARKTGKQKSQAHLIDAIAKQGAKGSAKLRALSDAFLRGYHARISVDDLLAKTSKAHGAVAMHHLKCAQRRRPGETIIRVFNPTLKKHGWDSDFTAIQMVTSDKPFLLDSVVAELNRLSVPVRLSIHPVIHVARKKDGTLENVFKAPSNSKSQAESFIYIEVNGQTAEAISEIQKCLSAVLTEVSLAVEDWQKMRSLLIDVVEDLKSAKTKSTSAATDEACEFLRWAHDNHFTLLGFREYDFTGAGTKAQVKIINKTALGILRDKSRVVFQEIRELASMPQQVRNFVSSAELLVANKTDTLSRVHRAVHMDSIGIKKFDEKGRVIGQRVFVGLYTAGVYTNSASDVPLLRSKIKRTFARSGFSGVSHDGKALLNILETYPRDELFQVSDDKLLEISMGILHLQDRQKVSMFLRHDDFERFVSCLIYIPRDSYTTDLRLRLQHMLETVFNGKVATHYAQLGDQALARLHVIVATTPGAIPKYNVDALENDLREEARTWGDRLDVALIDAHGEAEGARLLEIYRNAFDAGYRHRFSAVQSLDDIAHIETVYRQGSIGLNLSLAENGDDDGKGNGASAQIKLRFKAYHPREPLALSGVLPILEHFGLNVIEELPYRVQPQGGQDWISLHDFGLEPSGELPAKFETARDNFHTAFDKVWSGEMESDGFNALILFAGLDWREVTVLRALTKYLRQTTISFSEAYMAQTLVSNPRIAKGIADIFKTKFEYSAAKGAVQKAAAKAGRIKKRLVDMLDDVESADQDRILRRFLNLTDAALRTNFYQQTPQGGPKEYLSIKFSSQDIEELPLPRPKFEIFVYSPRIEGVHLRFGNVARGGLRWSDRPEDFRTEILGLVKAQQVKNAVIVPVGSKGGFVVKRPPTEGGREAFMAEGIECYKNFIR
ncbi:MAG: NAD-glutamate dehydrogenase, partial [Rhodospirillaceae bacterium]|nr:NAD-glutamate dehydrogenase [Rhodospirillaceae bacterium]